jgi:hypothetical protein
MAPLRALMDGLRRLLRKSAFERDLDDELSHYLEMAAREHTRAGMTREVAMRAARVEMGGLEATKDHAGVDLRIQPHVAGQLAR